jgi:phospholipid/cholesterol/gamma-HCH transport system substrate-binding protein
VAVALMINHGIRIPDSVLPRIELALIGGGAVLKLTTAQLPPTEGGQWSYLPIDGTAHINGRYRSFMSELTEYMDARMQPLMAALEDFQRLADTYDTLGRNLNGLVEPQTEQSLAKGEAPNLRTAVAKLNTVLDDAKAALSLARQWLGDDQLRVDAQASVQKAGALIDRATAAVDRFTKLADGLGSDAQQLVQRLLPVADELGETLEQIRQIMRTASTGKGTIAQLLNNPDLYDSLNDAAQRLDAALTEARLLIEKIKAEGLPIQY